MCLRLRLKMNRRISGHDERAMMRAECTVAATAAVAGASVNLNARREIEKRILIPFTLACLSHLSLTFRTTNSQTLALALTRIPGERERER